MAYTREDVAAIKTALVIALDRYIAMTKGTLAAAENCRRNVMMVMAALPDAGVLTLHDTPETVAAKTSFVRELAEKISNVSSPAPGNGK